MSEEIKVTVCKYPDRKNLVLRFVDPVTGKQKTQSAGTADEGEAIKAAGKWEDELRSGRYEAPNKLTWAEFRKRYTLENLNTLAPQTKRSADTAFNHVERVLNPDRLAKLTTANISHLQSELRKPRVMKKEVVVNGKRVTKTITKPGMTDVTLAKTLRHLRAALSWAVSMGMLAKVPDMHSPKRAKGAKMMKGRAISGEEFDRLLAVVPKVRPKDGPVWTRLLNGLWLSGLRLAESVALDWDEGPFSVDLSGKHPRFRILGEAQKSGRDELLPMTPDFAAWLLETPEAERVGKVFKLIDPRNGRPMLPHRVGEVVGEIGATAGVVVDKAADKFASAHDLRRSFGTRWARRVMPATLRRLMRHASVNTTMSFYVDIDTDELAADLWAKFGNSPAEGNILGNSTSKSRKTRHTTRGTKS